MNSGPGRLPWVDIILLFFSLLLLVIANRNGIAYTFDSDLYERSARVLIEQGFSGFFVDPAFRAKPPLYPTFLSLWIGSPNVLWCVQILLFGGFQFVTLRAVRSIRMTGMLTMVLRIAVVCATPTYLLYHFLWSETVFMLVLAIYFWALWQAINMPRYSPFYVIIILGILLPGIRHIGIIFPVVASIFLIIHHRKTQYLSASMIAFAAPIVAFITWQILTFQQTGNLNRLDHFSGLILLDNWHEISLVVTRWLVPTYLIPSDWLIPDFTLLAVLALIIYYPISQGKIQQSMLTISACTLVYITAIMTKADLIPSDIERYLAVVYLPILMLLFLAIDALVKHKPRYLKWLNSLVVIWLIYTVVRVVKNIASWGEFLTA